MHLFQHCIPFRVREVTVIVGRVDHFSCSWTVTVWYGMDWADDATGLIITSGACCAQEAWAVNDTSGGRSGTQSCWWLVDQTCLVPILDSNSWMCRISNFSTADLHKERQSALSIASASSSEGAILQRFNVDLRQSLYHLYCPPGRRKPWWNCP